MLEKFNEIGNKYGKLVIIERAENYKNGSAQWYCLCDCGNPIKVKVRASSLRDGHTQSCGCLIIETTKKIHTNKLVSVNTKIKQSKAAIGKENLNSRSDIGRKYPQRGKYNRGSLIVRKVNGIINSARKRKLDFTISKDVAADFLIKPCFYCQKQSIITGHKECSGIDRVDNNLGYVEGNCVPCCFYCNSCKNSRSLNDFIEHVKNMYNNLVKGFE